MELDYKTDNKREFILNKLLKYNQEHLIKLYDYNILKNPKLNIFDYLNNINLELIINLYKNKQCIKESMTPSIHEVSKLTNTFNQYKISIEQYKNYYKTGLNSILKGKIALLILAAGQGSRLGFNEAKAKYNIGFPSNFSLIQYQLSKILALQNLNKNKLNAYIPVIIHTSKENNEEIKEYIKQNNYFGLNKDYIYYFENTISLSSLDNNGKIIIKSSSEILQSPNGNGGCLLCLKYSGILDVLINKLGIDIINIVSIDNPLIKVLDPVYIGYHVSNNKENQIKNKINTIFSVKYIDKIDPNEKCGVFLKYKNKPYMLDYVNISKDISCELDENGSLKYSYANILCYLINTKELNTYMSDKDCIEKYNKEYNCVSKRVKCYNFENNESVEIDSIKFELFLNSIFQFANSESNFNLFYTKREDEFSPVKQLEGDTNTPSCTKKDLNNLHLKWLNNVGFEVFCKDLNCVLNKAFFDKYKDYFIDINYAECYDNNFINKTNIINYFNSNCNKNNDVEITFINNSNVISFKGNNLMIFY